MMRALFFLIFISNNSFSQIKDSHVPVRHINKTIKEVIYENHFIEDREIYKVEMQIKKMQKIQMSFQTPIIVWQMFFLNKLITVMLFLCSKKWIPLQSLPIMMVIE